MTAGPPNPPAAPRSRRRSWIVALLLLAAFGFGAVCGGAVTVVVVLKRAREMVRHPERRVPEGVKWLARKLDLTDAQREKISAILQRQYEDFTALRREAGPRVRQRLEQTDREVSEVLTETQRPVWRDLADRLRRDWMPAEFEGQPPAVAP
jgi:hypothetical protein